MSTTYTPSSTFTNPPWVYHLNDDVWNQTTVQDLESHIYDKLYYLKTNLDLAGTYLTNAQTKLGIVFTDAVLPTYGTSPYVLTGSKTFYDALKTLDAQASIDNTKFSNINNNVGGSVTGAATPVYTNTYFISNGDSHHTAIAKLDDTANTINSTVGTHTTSINTINTSLGHMVTNIGSGINTATGMTFTSINFITIHEAINSIVDKFDRLLDGCRREAHRTKNKLFDTWHATAGGTVGAKVLFFDQTEDGIETSITTASIDTYRVLVSGTAGQVVYIAQTLDSSCDQAKFYMDGDTNFWDDEDVVIKYNCIGSHNNTNMTEISVADITGGVLVPSASGAGTGLVIKLEFTATAQVYEVFVSLSHS